MKFLRNAWSVAALSTEVTQALFSRKLLGTPVLMYRKRDGQAVAMLDRCPHRFAPLSAGVLKEDVVVCGYHGLQFDCSGACVHNPHGDGVIPKAAVVESYPLVERHGFVWIWLGDKALADPAKIPDYSFLDDAVPTSIGYAYMHSPAHFEVMTDNIMDLSHADFVHGPLLQTNGQLTRSKAQLTEVGDDVVIRWEWVQNPAQGFFSQFLPDQTGAANQWVEVRWSAPASMYLHVGAVQGSKDYDKGLVFLATHIMTAETESTSHYFYAGRRNWLVEDAQLNAIFLEATLGAFRGEDMPMVSKVQEAMGGQELFSLSPVLLTCDMGAIRARRKLAALLAAQG